MSDRFFKFFIVYISRKSHKIYTRTHSTLNVPVNRAYCEGILIFLIWLFLLDGFVPFQPSLKRSLLGYGYKRLQSIKMSDRYELLILRKSLEADLDLPLLNA